MVMRDWVKLPTRWINLKGLREFRWDRDLGSDHTAALMALLVISHHADEESGIVRLTYNELTAFTGLSRAKLSGGLRVLEENGIVDRGPHGRSTYRLVGCGSPPWGKLPARRLYQIGRIAAFSNFFLRKSVELNALKMFFLVVERRDNLTNLANITYDKIHDYSGIKRHHIKSAISFLAANGLMHVECVPSKVSEHGISNAYRLPHIDSYSHLGTKGRSQETGDFV